MTQPHSKLRSYLPYWQTLLSATLIVFSFPPWDFTFLIWFALVPWIFSLERVRTAKEALREGLYLSVFMTLGGFYWVGYVLQQFGNLPGWLATIGLLLFSTFGQPQFHLFAWFHFQVRKRRLLEGLPFYVAPIFFAVTYTAIDFAIPKLFKDNLGHAFYRYENLRQITELAGVPFLTWLLLWMNFSIREVFREKRILAPLGAVVGLALLSTLWGWQRVDTVRQWISEPKDWLRAGVIQANIGDFDKVAAERGYRGAALKILQTYFRLSDEAITSDPRPDFLVWPETAYFNTFRHSLSPIDAYHDQLVENYVRKSGVPLFFGGYDTIDKKDFNSLFALSPHPLPGEPEGSDLLVYHKNRLLLFGEYIPLSETFTQINQWFPQVGNFGRGPGPGVFRFTLPSGTEVKYGPAICYEVLYADYGIESARGGADFILNVTNDSWFGREAEPHLHLALSIFRSVETRLPMIRSTNTGFTALVLPDGEITHRTPLWEEKTEIMRVPILKDHPPTLLVRWGNWFGLALILLSITGSGALVWRGRV